MAKNTTLKNATSTELMNELFNKNPEGIFVVICGQSELLYNEPTELLVKATPDGLDQIFGAISSFVEDYREHPDNSKKGGKGFDQHYRVDLN